METSSPYAVGSSLPPNDIGTPPLSITITYCKTKKEEGTRSLHTLPPNEKTKTKTRRQEIIYTDIKNQQVETTRQEPKGIYRFRLAEDPGHGLACILENIRSHNTVHGNVGLQIHSRHGGGTRWLRAGKTRKSFSSNCKPWSAPAQASVLQISLRCARA